MPKHPDDFRHTDLGEHPFDAQLQRSLEPLTAGLPYMGGAKGSSGKPLTAEDLRQTGKQIHIDAATYDRERRRTAVMGAVCIGSILLGMLIGVLAICQGPQIRDRLEAQLYGERV